MIGRMSLWCAGAVLIAASVCASKADAQFISGGGYGLGFFNYGNTGVYFERIPYYALYPPVYYSYPVPRTYWREAVYSTQKPLLYVVRPGWLAEQAANLARNRPGTQVAVFNGAGHALFVDDAARFNSLLAGFIARTVWP